MKHAHVFIMLLCCIVTPLIYCMPRLNKENIKSIARKGQKHNQPIATLKQPKKPTFPPGIAIKTEKKQSSPIKQIDKQAKKSISRQLKSSVQICLPNSANVNPLVGNPESPTHTVSDQRLDAARVINQIAVDHTDCDTQPPHKIDNTDQTPCPSVTEQLFYSKDTDFHRACALLRAATCKHAIFASCSSTSK